MKQAEVAATFQSAPADWTTLSKPCRATMEALYRHPLSHNVEWPAVVALFEKLGTVDHKAHNEMVFGLDGEHHRVRKPHNKNLKADEVMAFRHMLSRAGWAPQGPSVPAAAAEDASVPADILVVVDHHEARLYHLAVRAADPAGHVIKPHDPHHLLHHLSHKDHPRERGQRTPEDHDFYKRIAQAIAPAGAIVLIGHGKGHSNAAHHLAGYLGEHHPETFQRVTSELVADLSSLTVPQLLGLGRRALTPHAAETGS